MNKSPLQATSIPTPEAQEVSQLLESLRVIYGYDFTQYSLASIRRRLTGFMITNHYKDFATLRSDVIADEKLFNKLLENFTVTVTELFRDPSMYKALREKVLPYLNTWPFIRIWHAGCSTGEEVYSMAILLREESLLNKSRIYATDINTKALDQAINGTAHLSLIKEYTKNYQLAGGHESFAGYYTVKDNHVQWDQSLSKQITFSHHNLVSDKSFNEFNMIVCRNVMIYFNRQLQQKVMKLFLDSLAISGFLILGSKESLLLSEYAGHFEVVDKQEKIYRRVR